MTRAELTDEVGAAFRRPGRGHVVQLLTDDDLGQIAAGADPQTTTLVLAWEDRWAAASIDAVTRVGGLLLDHDGVPQRIAERARAASAQEAWTLRRRGRARGVDVREAWT